MTHKPIKLLRQIYYCLLDCNKSFRFPCDIIRNSGFSKKKNNKKQCAKHSIYDFQSQIEIEKDPTLKKKKNLNKKELLS